jgi:hypothetical protein
VGDQTERLRPIKAGFACGSMVLFYLFSGNVALQATFPEKRW